MLAGVFVGTVGELVEFCGQQGVILGIGKGVDTEAAPDDEGARRFRCQWGSGLPASSALKVIADQVGEDVQVLRRGETSYVLGVPESSDLVGRVYYVPTGYATDYVEAVSSIVSGAGSVSSIGDSIVVRDTAEGVRMCDELFDAMQSARGQWIVEVKFIELTRRAATRLGVEWDLTGAVTLNGEILGTQGVQELIAVTLGGLAEANAMSEDLALLSGVRLHVVEGRDAELQVGETVPVPTSSIIGDDGRLVTQDFEDVDTGVLLRVGVRTEPNGLLRVSLDPEISSISGFVENRPIRSRRRVFTEAVIQPGGSLVAGGFYQDSSNGTSEGIHASLLRRPGLSFDTDEHARSRIFILATVHPAGTPTPGMEQTAEQREVERIQRAYEIWREEAPEDPQYLVWLLGGEP
ncbi:MAG: hypothetical protein AAF333_07510 [Planctomycetota bacterium]